MQQPDLSLLVRVASHLHEKDDWEKISFFSGVPWSLCIIWLSNPVAQSIKKIFITAKIWQQCLGLWNNDWLIYVQRLVWENTWFVTEELSLLVKQISHQNIE